jgi:hypothetical protein
MLCWLSIAFGAFQANDQSEHLTKCYSMKIGIDYMDMNSRMFSFPSLYVICQIMEGQNKK